MPMSLNIKKTNLGFTLVELLVAIVIFAGVSMVGVQLLWDTLSTRSKQTSIESSSDNFRLFVSTLTKAVQSARSVKVDPADLSKIEITAKIDVTGEPCRTIKLNTTDQTIVQATDNTLPFCQPPDDSASFSPLTKPEIKIQQLEFSSPGNSVQVVTIKIKGVYEDNLGDHPLDFQTTIMPRITL